MSFFSHLECSVPCGEGPYDPRREQHLCGCGAPLLARYDLEAARAWRRESLAGRESTMWRYRELMPLFDGEEPLTLGEGWTPLIRASKLGRKLGLERLLVKDESLNPTNSFKARGLSAAVTRAKYLDAKVLSIPSAGNAANAMAAYAASAGLQAKVFMGYKTTQSVDIEPGEERSVSLVPTGDLSANATPWAEVWLDGKKIGDTPLAGQRVPLGTHEVVFKNPQFPERRVTVTVTASNPVTASVDFNKQ